MTQKAKDADSTGGSVWVSHPIGPANTGWLESPTSDYPLNMALCYSRMVLRRSTTHSVNPHGLAFRSPSRTPLCHQLDQQSDSHNIRRSSPIRNRTDLMTVGTCLMTLTAFVFRAVGVYFCLQESRDVHLRHSEDLDAFSEPALLWIFSRKFYGWEPSRKRVGAAANTRRQPEAIGALPGPTPTRFPQPRATISANEMLKRRPLTTLRVLDWVLTLCLRRSKQPTEPTHRTTP